MHMDACIGLTDHLESCEYRVTERMRAIESPRPRRLERVHFLIKAGNMTYG